jgi:hypothetical protein
MSIESTIDPAVTNAAIDAETSRIIAASCARHNIQPSQLPPGAADDARRAAREFVELQQDMEANPVYKMLEAERAAHKLTQMQLNAAKQVRPTMGSNTPPVANVEITRARMGEREWFALTNDGRLQSCGIDPATVTPLVREECAKLFGRKMDSAYSSNFFKQDGGRYHFLKNVAIILGIQGQ